MKYRKFLSFMLVFAFAIISGCSGANTSIETSSLRFSAYQNPITDYEFADPSAFLDDDGYVYVFATEGGYIRTKDFKTTEYVGNVFFTSGTPLWGSNGAHVWAPHVVKIDEYYIYYYSLSAWGDANPGIGYCYTTDLYEGIWTLGEKLFLSSEIGVNNSIDPFVIVENSRVYMTWGSFSGVYLIELTADGRSLLGGIDEAYHNKIKIAGNFEGSFIYKKENDYYLYLSRGGCCNGLSSSYETVVFKSKNLKGPYLDENGVDAISGGGNLVLTSSAYFRGPGHNAIYSDSKGTDWIIYHSYNLDSPNRRLLMIDPLHYDENGFPEVEGKVPSFGNEKGPAYYGKD
jgi:arabinan endo-1,5-alpha-L-arabinosidase